MISPRQKYLYPEKAVQSQKRLHVRKLLVLFLASITLSGAINISNTSCDICKQWAEVNDIKNSFRAEIPGGYTVTFKPDKTLLYQDELTKSTGKWHLDTRSRVLTITLFGRTRQYRVVKLTPDTLVLAKDGSTFIHYTSAFLKSDSTE